METLKLSSKIDFILEGFPFTLLWYTLMNRKGSFDYCDFTNTQCPEMTLITIEKMHITRTETISELTKPREIDKEKSASNPSCCTGSDWWCEL